jgi:integrase
MNSLRQALNDYLVVRRALGFKLARDGEMLPDFISFLERSDSAHITSALAVKWATQPRDVHPAWWASRLIIVRGFAKYLQGIDPHHEVPPFELLPHRRLRSAPYIYEPAEIDALLRATTTLRSPLMSATYKTLIGLLAVAGLRVREAITLAEADVDRVRGTLLIRKTKFGKSREVPLHPTTTEALGGYAELRDRLVARRRTKSFFVSTANTPLIYNNVHIIFLRLVYAAGLADRCPRRPRIHDLRQHAENLIMPSKEAESIHHFV